MDQNTIDRWCAHAADFWGAAGDGDLEGRWVVSTFLFTSYPNIPKQHSPSTVLPQITLETVTDSMLQEASAS